MKINNKKITVVNELHKPIRKNFVRRKVVQKGISDTWQADLIILDAYAKFNRGYRYLLTVIDIFSKQAWAIALKTNP